MKLTPRIVHHTKKQNEMSFWFTPDKTLQMTLCTYTKPLDCSTTALKHLYDELDPI